MIELTPEMRELTDLELAAVSGGDGWSCIYVCAPPGDWPHLNQSLNDDGGDLHCELICGPSFEPDPPVI